MSQSFDRVCGWCGSGLLPADRFCPKCGNRVYLQAAAVVTNETRTPAEGEGGDSSSVNPKSNPKRGSTGVAAIVFSFGLIVLLVALIAIKHDGSIGAGPSGEEVGELTGTQGRCDGAKDYALRLASWQVRVRTDLQQAGFYENGSWERMPTNEEFASMAIIFEDHFEELDKLTAPKSAQEFHEEFHKSMDFFGDMLNSMGKDGVFAAQAYAERIGKQDARLSEAAVQFEIVCNVAISDEDNDGVKEIG